MLTAVSASVLGVTLVAGVVAVAPSDADAPAARTASVIAEQLNEHPQTSAAAYANAVSRTWLAQHRYVAVVSAEERDPDAHGGRTARLVLRVLVPATAGRPASAPSTQRAWTASTPPASTLSTQPASATSIDCYDLTFSDDGLVDAPERIPCPQP